MQQRQLGAGGPVVGEVGLGAMSLAGAFGPTDEATGFKTLDAALDLGVTHIDTALIYGPYLSEEILGRYLQRNPSARQRFSIATKGGFKVNGREVPALSGSTLDILGLAMRVALTRTFLPSAPFIVLDEPAAACDEQRTHNMLAFIAGAGVEQVILCSHDGSSVAVSDAVLELED